MSQILQSLRARKENRRRLLEMGLEKIVDSDILAFTSQELEEAMPTSRFLRHVMDTGRVVYEKGSQG